MNISLEAKGEKKKKGQGKAGHKGKYEKENTHNNEQRRSILENKNLRDKEKEKESERLVLPTIENKRINYRRWLKSYEREKGIGIGEDGQIEVKHKE